MRIIENLNFKWSFSKIADAVPEQLPEMWDVISLPHCWNRRSSGTLYPQKRKPPGGQAS